MADLVQWLRAQLDADAAEIADPYAEKAWHTRDCAIHPDAWGNEGSSCDCGVPARVLREVEAKRWILDLHSLVGTLQTGARIETVASCPICRVWPCSTVRLLASVYADRDGYQEGWAP